MIRWVLAGLLLAAPAQAADLTVLTAGAYKSVAAALLPAFEAKTGDKVILRNDTTGALIRRIEAGEQFDVVLISPSGLDQLAKAGKIVPASETKVAKVGVGVAVKRGAPKPDISSVAAFKAAMLNARSVAYLDPAAGGSSGIYVAQLFKTLGIADAIAPKAVLVNGGLAAEAVADGRAEIVVHQISEILMVPGATLVGPLPAEIQSETVYAGAVGTASASPDSGRAFLAALTGPAARSVLIDRGMTPP
jgi:molybdate transport system substrate-binding protein